MLMKSVLFLLIGIFCVGIFSLIQGGDNSKGGDTPLFYNFVMKTIDGKEVKLDEYRGKTLLLVNVASKCGYTPQYEGLQKIYSKYKDKGFIVLGFPANNFGAQEPGSDQEIKSFCSTRYNVTFPMF